jgi:hypothetical protein
VGIEAYCCGKRGRGEHGGWEYVCAILVVKILVVKILVVKILVSWRLAAYARVSKSHETLAKD